MAAGMVALSVALAVVALGLPPMGWAADPAPAAIPALPPAELKIPSEGITVTASTERQPGEAVTVRLDCECSGNHSRQSVPLVVHVFKNDPTEMVGRMAGSTRPSEVAKVECSCPIDSDGKGFTTVDLPLTWTPDDAPKPEKGKPAASFFLMLTSPLTPAQVTVPPPAKAAQPNSRQAR